jgi:hypothetical protein
MEAQKKKIRRIMDYPTQSMPGRVRSSEAWWLPQDRSYRWGGLHWKRQQSWLLKR